MDESEIYQYVKIISRKLGDSDDNVIILWNVRYDSIIKKWIKLLKLD